MHSHNVCLHTNEPELTTACEVCNDKSTGKHYGVFVCDGCSGFFKRSVRRSIPWVCRSNGKCVVDKASRTECRACRFNKCLVVNMNPEGVQTPRGSRVPHDRKNTTSDSDSNNSFSANPSPHPETISSVLHSGREQSAYEIKDDSDSRPTFSSSDISSTLTTNTKHSSPVPLCSSPPLSMAVSSVGALQPLLPNRTDSPVMVKIEVDRRDTRSGDHIANNVENDPDNDVDYGRRAPSIDQMVVMQPTNIRPSGVTPSQHGQMVQYRGRVHDTYDPGITNQRPVIFSDPPSFTGYRCPTPRFSSNSVPRCTLSNTRVRNSPSASITLPYASSESLYTMAVRLLSSAVKFAKNIPSFKLLAFRDQIILLEESWKDLFILDAAFWSFPLEISYIMNPLEAKKESNVGLVASFRSLQELVARVQALEMDEAECAHLKTVVIFKPDIKGLKDSQQVEKFQDDAQVKLSEYSKVKNTENPARFGRLLLTLLAFERVSQEVIEKLFFQSQNEKISVEFILHDMFKST